MFKNIGWVLFVILAFSASASAQSIEQKLEHFKGDYVLTDSSSGPDWKGDEQFCPRDHVRIILKKSDNDVTLAFVKVESDGKESLIDPDTDHFRHIGSPSASETLVMNGQKTTVSYQCDLDTQGALVRTQQIATPEGSSKALTVLTEADGIAVYWYVIDGGLVRRCTYQRLN